MNSVIFVAVLVASTLVYVDAFGGLATFPPDLMAAYAKIKAPFFACMKGKGFELVDGANEYPTPVEYPNDADGWLKFADSLAECFSNGKDDTQCCQKAGVTDEEMCLKLCNGKPPVDLKAAGLGLGELMTCAMDAKTAVCVARCLIENYN